MNRRKALAFLGISALAGCGGGGGGGATTAATSASSATTGSGAGAPTTATPSSDTAQQSTPSTTASGGSPSTTAGNPATAPVVSGGAIACWGDSITNLYAPHLQAMLPGRQVFNGGIVGQTSDQINARVQADASHRSNVSVFWYGHNDWFKDKVAANLDASIATLAPGTPFVVISMLNWATDLPGSTMYNSVLQANQALAQKYPNNFLDMRSWLVSQYNGSIAQDVTDHSNDETPSSLRFDTIHPNEAGCELIAAHVRDFISAKGW